MRRLDLEKKIHDLIRTEYNAEYIGRLEVYKVNTSYQLIIGIPSYMAPTTISADCETDQEFLNFVLSELKLRNYMRLEIYKVVRTPNFTEE